MSERSSTGGHLRVVGLEKRFGGVRALAGVTFEVRPGELLGLIGPNGSGKTTAVDCITGFTNADSAQVELDGIDISGWRPDRLADLGLVRTFQQVRIFGSMTVAENIKIGAFALPRQGSVRRRGPWSEVEQHTAHLIDLLELGHVAHLPASTLSYGQRKLVELGVALQCRPTVLILDEPVAAINPTLAASIQDHILDLNAAGTSILLIEHNMEVVTGVCQRLIVLDHGVKIAEGPPSEVMARPEVQEAYFGK